jgi:CheY-like chemotaxis protein
MELPVWSRFSAEIPAAETPRPLRFLVVDDVAINRLVLKAMLTHEGYEVELAENGKDAVEACARELPDMVLLDVMMPVMDGYEAVKRIKALAGERFVPVILLTVLQDESALARCIEAGGDDFLTKPINRTLLKSKIDALLRMRSLYSALHERNVALKLHQNEMEREQEIAEGLLAKVVHRGCLDSPGIRYLLSPMSLFNGDVLLAARRPSGGLHLLVGDFSGHGLTAAVGTMPIAEIFYVMTEKGYGIRDIVAEMNRKLRMILPSNMFFAACLMSFDSQLRSLAVWNGGMPAPIVVAADGSVMARFGSRHLALGIAETESMDFSAEIVGLAPACRVYAFTDGLTEARSPGGAMFGDEELDGVFRNEAADGWFNHILESLAEHRRGLAQHDDITLAEIDCAAAPAPGGHQAEPAKARRTAAREWSLTLDFGASALRTVDPLPALMNVLLDVQGLEEHRERLYMILAELFNNALDHGLLRLDSSLKNSASGFGAYLDRRREALARLEQGRIRIGMHHQPAESGGRLTVEVEDSGSGFDFERVVAVPPGAGAAGAGRGMTLLRSRCRVLTYFPPGNRVEAVYEWS